MDKFIILIAILAILIGIIIWQRKRSAATCAELTREREKINREEHRMFAFLHGLGEVLAQDHTAIKMYEIISHGVADVMDGRSCALYLYDPRNNELVPTFFTPDCPPLVPLPDEVVGMAVRNEKSIGSYMRLATVAPGEGVIGAAFAEDRTIRIADLGEQDGPPGFKTDFHRGLTVMAASLAHGNKHLGVLAVAGFRDTPAFTEHEFDLFRSVAEQSAFALGNALIHQEAADKKHIENELKAAREIQRILLPSDAPTLQDYRLFADNYAAKVVSGDYYDFIEIDKDHFGVAIADVSGKGIPASLIMAICRSVLRANAPGNHSPAAVLAAVNRLVFPDTREDMFISMAYLVLNKNNNEITIARAGHDPPMHYIRREHRIEIIKPPGLALGIDSGAVFERITRDYRFTVEPGDAVLLYTDGANEALNQRGEEFGLDSLADCFLTTADHGAEAVVSAILGAVRDFMGDATQNDDITLIAIEKR